MARWIPHKGRAVFVRPQTPPHFTVPELVELLRTTEDVCLFDVVPGFRMGSTFLICPLVEKDETLPINESASVLARQPIRGDVLLISQHEWN